MKVLLFVFLGLCCAQAQADDDKVVVTFTEDAEFTYSDNSGQSLELDLSRAQKQQAVIETCRMIVNLDIGDINIGDVEEGATVTVNIVVKPDALRTECEDIVIENNASQAGESSWSGRRSTSRHDYKL